MRLAPLLGMVSLALVASAAGVARATPCTPVRIERAGADLPVEWMRALTELTEATTVLGQAWSCSGGALAIAVDASGRSATLTFTDAGGRRVERRIPRAEDLVPSTKALLALPQPDALPLVEPPIAVIAPRNEPPPVLAAPPAEPRFLVDALLGARYRNPESAIWGAATLRGMVPFGAWSAGFWFRGAVPASLERPGVMKRNLISSEATLGLSGGRRLVDGPFQLHVTFDPSLTFAFQPIVDNGQPGRHDELAVHINGQLGLGLRGTFPIAGPIRGAVALDGELLPDTLGGGLSLGVEAVIR